MKVNDQVRTFGLVLAGAVSATVMWHVFGSAIAASNADTYKQLNLFGDVFDRVRADYVEDPDESKMIEAAINGMLTSLDPHSSYMDAKRFEDMSVQTKGEFGGLGLPLAGHLWWDKRNWGYRTFEDKATLQAGYEGLIEKLEPLVQKGLAAAIYTQTTDVEGEINGLLTYDRQVVKFDTAKLAALHKKLIESGSK